MRQRLYSTGVNLGLTTQYGVLLLFFFLHRFPAENEVNTNDSIKCIVYYGNGKTEVGVGKNRKIAKIMAAYRVLKKEKR